MSAYHLPFSECMRLTLPQIIMLNHAAWKEQKESDARADARRKAREREEQQDALDPKLGEFGNSRLSDIATDDKRLDAYMTNLIQSGFGDT